MTIFYQGPGVRITDKVFEVRTPSMGTFFLDDLRDSYVTRYSTRRVRPRVAITIAVAVAVAAVGIAVTIDSTVAWVAAAAVVAVVIGSSWALARPAYELRALYKGTPVTLYGSSDIQEFAQVCRALARALEHAADK